MAKYPFTKKCELCNSDFVIKYAWGRHVKFCSLTCASNNRRKHARESSCLKCESPLIKDQKKFCSQSCAASFNNSQRECQPINTRIKISHTRLKNLGKQIDHNKDYTIKACKTCGKPCSSPNRLYCSIKCSSSFIKIKHCVICGCEFETRSNNKTCQKHKTKYRMKDREIYEFKFNVFDYPELFDLDMLKTIGFKNRSNPNGIVRDHKVSIHEAKKQGYDPYYISHVMNCELLRAYDNTAKGARCSISYEELVKLVDEYDAKNDTQRLKDDATILKWFK